MTQIYRKIYERHIGPIPLDEEGRSYDIHHIDGNRQNNDLSNLIAVSMDEHFNIHYQQGDYAACLRLAERMSKDKSVISEIARMNALKRLEKGTHHFIGINERRVKEGTHNWLDGKRNREIQMKRIAEGTHHLLGPNHNLQRIKNGNHPSQIKVTCAHCGLTVSKSNHTRWHGDRCRSLSDATIH